MTRLCMSFFTNEVIQSIRKRHQPIRGEHLQGYCACIWQTYREYHHTHLERVTSQNAVFIMREFQLVCETIATFPDERFVHVYLSRKF